jgi:hypothetical protein
MCHGFCDLLDWIQEQKPFRSVRNYPLPKAPPAMSEPTVFKRIQERFERQPPPKLQKIDSFNYDAFAG